MKTRARTLTALVMCVCLACVVPADADVVTDWNAVTVLYVSTGGPGTPQVPPVGRGGPPGLLDIALVHLAMHDAIQAIERKFEPYHYSDRTKFGVGNPAAAAAAAAHRVLVVLYPGQKDPLDAFYENYLLTNGLDQDPGLEVGEAAGSALHAKHHRAPTSLPAFLGSDDTGAWRPVPPTAPTTGMAFLDLAFIKPFTLRSPSQFRVGPPPPLWSRQYARDYDEVKAKGNKAAHPNPTTDMALFWSGNFFAQWNEAMREIATAQIHNDIGRSARLFALGNMAAADAAITVWDSKYRYNFWRPYTAIREGDNDGNSRTIGDPNWEPLIATPNYPDYTSGANGVTGAFTTLLALFFGRDNIEFSVKNTNPAVVNQVRKFKYFSDAAEEVVEARILLGIHFRFADVEARKQGTLAAVWTYFNALRPERRGHH